MPDREMVMKALKCRVTDPVVECGNCPYNDAPDDWRQRCDFHRLCADALALLKEQEPRVMTLDELWGVGRVWESSEPPYLWLDKNRSIYNTISFWCAWRDIYEMINGRHDKYTDENYGSEWRCWTSRPSPEQMRDTPWEGENETM